MFVIVMADKFGHAEVLRRLSRVQLLRCIAVLQPLIVYAEIHLYTYLPVSLLMEAVYNSEYFFIIDWLFGFCCREGVCIVLN